jgi:hypothetical protein
MLMEQILNRIERFFFITVMNYLTLIVLVFFVEGVLGHDSAVEVVFGSLGLIVSMILQPWSIVILFIMLYSPVDYNLEILLLLFPLVVSIFTTVIYSNSNFQAYHEISQKFKFIWKKNTKRNLGIIVAVYFMITFARIVDFPTTSTESTHYFNDKGIKYSSSFYYEYKVGFEMKEWLWRAKMDKPSVDSLISLLDMNKITSERKRTIIHKRPYWWDPEINDSTILFATDDFPYSSNSPNGSYYLLVWNERDQNVFLWVYRIYST